MLCWAGPCGLRLLARLRLRLLRHWRLLLLLRRRRLPLWLQQWLLRQRRLLRCSSALSLQMPPDDLQGEKVGGGEGVCTCTCAHVCLGIKDSGEEGTPGLPATPAG